MSANLNIHFVTGGKKQISFNPTEPTWSFSKRLGLMLGTLRENTTSCLILLHNHPVNTFQNRLEPIGRLIEDPSQPVYGVLEFYPNPETIGNSSPLGGEHEICAICLEKLQSYQSGPEPNLIALVLKCNHTFHQGCIEEWKQRKNKCPVCNATPIELQKW